MGVPLQAVFLAIFIHTLWGGNPVAVKFGLLAFPPLWSAFIRFTIGIICIALWARGTGVPLWPKRGAWSLLVGMSTVVGPGIDHAPGRRAFSRSEA